MFDWMFHQFCCAESELEEGGGDGLCLKIICWLLELDVFGGGWFGRGVLIEFWLELCLEWFFIMI